MKFEEMFEKDFIRHLINHDNKPLAEARDILDSCSEEYIEDIYQCMSDSIWHYKSIFEKETLHKEVA